TNAALARGVVDAAISEWQNTIVNFNQVSHGDNNHIDVTISMNTDNNSGGSAVTNTTATDPNGKPTAANITITKYGSLTTDPTGFSRRNNPTLITAQGGKSSAVPGTAGPQFAGRFSTTRRAAASASPRPKTWPSGLRTSY